eukprot:CAMPEP_0202716888 /NCGR_PEP_ID=MMETSP1385-20130828/105886_1 /ASSEMBLY_ACC=CAM_ASM_000861 /TAXON_ID=933848 /ORGANISM="Elphidium margaritaceum" /LENGTH=238 /DNA_ID=CAMNT_0049378847 /DNA_START=40 /DNA_END=756 /DNA_ORIENTATION=-
MASALDIQAFKGQLKEENDVDVTTQIEPVKQPLIVEAAGELEGRECSWIDRTISPSHTKRDEFRKRSREGCGAFCDFGGCSFHGVSSLLIFLFIVRGLFNILVAGILLKVECTDANIHRLDDVLGPDFPYTCHEFHNELRLQLFDGVFAVSASLLAVVGLISLRQCCLIPVIAYGAVRIIYLLILISLYGDFVNVGAIIGVLFSVVWTLVFYNTYKIMKKTNIEWPTIELMKPASQSL